MKQLTDDLVNDKIIPDDKSLRDLTLNDSGMTVNGVKQPADVFKKYSEKYGKTAKTGMSYSRDGIYYNNN